MGAKLRDVKKLKADSNFTSKITNAVSGSKDAGWEHWWNGYPVPEEMLPLLKALETKMFYAEIYPADFSRASRYDDNKGQHNVCNIIDEFSVIMDGCPFDLGRFGYKDYAVNENKFIYGVYSRKIGNTKYHSTRDQYHMVMTTDLNKAVKNICKYIVPYTHRELATVYYRPIHDNLVDIFMKKAEKLRNISRSIRNDDDAILAELMHLKSLGVKFKTNLFQQASTQIEEAMLDKQEEEKRNVVGVFVRFRSVGDNTYADVMEAQDLRRSTNLKDASPVTTYELSELPHDIVGSISVLNILEDGQYVPRVGYKVDNTAFWIERG